jgi:ribosome-binding factor A
MAHTRDLRIAKQLHQAISGFFHQKDLDITIDEVIMQGKKHADVHYCLGHNQSINETNISSIHLEIVTFTPALRKHIADTINLKAIPTIHFHVRLTF